MGADIKQLRVRIKSVDSTRHLTKAMGLVASSKIRKTTDAMRQSAHYAAALQKVVSQLTLCPDCAGNPFMQSTAGEKLLLVVIAGDRGLAGGYNANVFRFMRDYSPSAVIGIGKRACERYGQPIRLAEYFTSLDAKAIAEDICKRFSEGEFDKVGVVYTKHHSMMSQETAITYLLPLAKAEEETPASMIFEPDEATVLEQVIPLFVAGRLMACVRESVASEVAARRVAMDSADKNAQEMLASLQLEYNRARQGSITQEITEIVAGSNA